MKEEECESYELVGFTNKHFVRAQHCPPQTWTLEIKCDTPYNLSSVNDYVKIVHNLSSANIWGLYEIYTRIQQSWTHDHLTNKTEVLHTSNSVLFKTIINNKNSMKGGPPPYTGQHKPIQQLWLGLSYLPSRRMTYTMVPYELLLRFWEF